jgi:hypothetical protein
MYYIDENIKNNKAYRFLPFLRSTTNISITPQVEINNNNNNI